MSNPFVVNRDVNPEILSSSLAENTRIAYEKGWNKFEEYCTESEIPDPLNVSPNVVADFLVTLATKPSRQSGIVLSMGTITLYKSAINKKYIEAGKASPTNHPIVIATLRGLARLKGSSIRRVEALREHHIVEMVSHCSESIIGKRDAALITLGFAGALRRSEICNLTFDDVEFLEPTQSGQRRMFLYIRKSKTDQQGRGHKIAIIDGSAIQPIHRLQIWLEASNITHGPLFRTMKRGGHVQQKQMHNSDIPRLVKKYAESIGLNSTTVAGHSLRAGFVTSAAVHHARLDKIMAVTRHTNPATVMQYIRDADSFNDHAGEKFM